ncbi:hypothetical protein ES703_74188 [subsurface metagenome]
MVMGPKIYIVVVLLEVIDFILGFHVTVLGDAEIDANSRFINRIKIQFRISDCFMSAVDRNRPRSRSTTQFFFSLINQWVKITQTSYDFTHVVGLDFSYSGFTSKQVLPKF